MDSNISKKDRGQIPDLLEDHFCRDKGSHVDRAVEGSRHEMYDEVSIWGSFDNYVVDYRVKCDISPELGKGNPIQKDLAL